jgi:hypothetical protein
MTEGNRLLPIKGRWLRPADGSALELNAAGIGASPASRWPTGWSERTARCSVCPSDPGRPAEELDPCAYDGPPARTDCRPGSVSDRLIGSRRLAKPNGRPAADRAAKAAGC